MQNKDIFFRQKYELMVAHGLQTKVLETLKREYKITEILVIEPKTPPKTAPLNGNNGIVKGGVLE